MPPRAPPVPASTPSTLSRVSIEARDASASRLAARTIASSSRSRGARPAGSSRSASVARRRSSTTWIRGGASTVRSVTASVPSAALRRHATCRIGSPGRYSRSPTKSVPGPTRRLDDAPDRPAPASSGKTSARRRTVRGSTRHSPRSSKRMLFRINPKGNDVSSRNDGSTSRPRRSGQKTASATTVSPAPTCCTKAREPGGASRSRT